MGDLIMSKAEAASYVDTTRIRQGRTWAELAVAMDRPLVWATSALLGQHPVPAPEAARVGELLGLDDAVVEALQQQPARGMTDELARDPTIYRFLEAISVYGPALKALIHEEFGDGIMSAINFNIDIERRADPAGDRVVVTLDGKFLDYHW